MWRLSLSFGAHVIGRRVNSEPANAVIPAVTPAEAGAQSKFARAGIQRLCLHFQRLWIPDNAGGVSGMTEKLFTHCARLNRLNPAIRLIQVNSGATVDAYLYAP